MNRISFLALLLMSACASPRQERYLQVSALEVDEGTLVALSLDSITAPRILLGPEDREAEVFIGESGTEDGLHALVQLDGKVVSVEAWERANGVESWRSTRSTTVLPPGRCSDPERFLAR